MSLNKMTSPAVEPPQPKIDNSDSNQTFHNQDGSDQQGGDLLDVPLRFQPPSKRGGRRFNHNRRGGGGGFNRGDGGKRGGIRRQGVRGGGSSHNQGQHHNDQGGGGGGTGGGIGGGHGHLMRNSLDKLNAISGPTYDIPPVEAVEEKFSGRGRLYIGNVGSDKMKELMISLVEARERREEKEIEMRLRNVRVVTGDSGQQYYATIKVTMEALIILPDDEHIPVSYFLPIHLRGYHEINDRAIRVNQRFNRESYLLHFRTSQQMGRVLNRIRSLTGAESTSEESTDG